MKPDFFEVMEVRYIDRRQHICTHTDLLLLFYIETADMIAWSSA